MARSLERRTVCRDVARRSRQGKPFGAPGAPIVMAVAALAAACARKEAPAGLGRQVAGGEVLALKASPDGAWLAYLHRCQPVKDRTLPAGTAACDLSVVPTAGGEPRRIAEGVTTLPYGFGWSASGATLAALAAYDHAEGRGSLVLWAGGAPRRVADGVTFHALDRAGKTAGWIAGGRLFLAAVAGGEATAVAGAEGVATFELGGEGGLTALARRATRAGGDLVGVRDGASTVIAADVRDYGFDRARATFAFTSGVVQKLALCVAKEPCAARPLGRNVSSFLFSPAGGAIAFVADTVPGHQGDLWVAVSGGEPRRVAERVGEPRWSADGSRLAWLQGYDPRSRTGTLAVGSPGERARTLAPNVSDFDLTPDGSWVAYLAHVTAGGYSVDLSVAPALPDVAAPPAQVARGVFGFGFSPDGKWLFYRNACVRQGEACDLGRVPAAGPAPGAKPERLVEGVKSFEFAPGRPERLLVSWSRKDRVALDLAMWEAGKLTSIDTYALPGSAQFVGGDPRRLAYAVVQAKRQGVYVAEVP
jgi:hypothetical protein